ncbi:hypothetical protein FOZ62_029582, partial [Perkinsus olseni]
MGNSSSRRRQTPQVVGVGGRAACRGKYGISVSVLDNESSTRQGGKAHRLACGLRAESEQQPQQPSNTPQQRQRREGSSNDGRGVESGTGLWPTVNWSGQSPLRQQQQQRMQAAYPQQQQQRPVYVFRDGRYVPDPTAQPRPYQAPYTPFALVQSIPEIKQTCVVKNPCNLRKDTIKFIDDGPDAPPKLRFVVDTSAPCVVRLHYFVDGDSNSQSSEALPEVKGVRTYTYELPHAALGQEVLTNDQSQRLDRRRQLPEEWTSTAYTKGSHRYPAVVEILSRGEAKPNDNPLHIFCKGQLTYLSFPPVEDSDVMMNVKVLKQRVLFSTQAYDMHDIYGIEAPRAVAHEEEEDRRGDTVEGKVVKGGDSPSSSEEESSNGEVAAGLAHSGYDDEADAVASECVICLSEPRTTVVLPCRHMCLCNDCAVRVQEANPGHVSAKCPICRQPVSSMLQIVTSSSSGESGTLVQGPWTVHSTSLLPSRCNIAVVADAEIVDGSASSEALVFCFVSAK